MRDAHQGPAQGVPPDFDYRSLVGDIARFLEQRTERALAAGVGAERLVVDPGIEFGKLLYQDLELLRRLPELGVLGYPVLVAVSRKDFIGNVLGLPAGDRLEGTAAAVAFSVFRGAHLVRVHDVRAMVRVTRMAEALVGLTRRGRGGGAPALGRHRDLSASAASAREAPRLEQASRSAVFRVEAVPAEAGVAGVAGAGVVDPLAALAEGGAVGAGGRFEHVPLPGP